MSRPYLRFTLRTLGIVVTLVCCYAACWGPTKRQGVEDVTARNLSDEFAVEAVAPLTIATDVEWWWPREPVPRYMERHYFFWFFGFVAKLPFEREISTK